jgi:hypothetical protein
MSELNFPIDESVFDRMVDGELDARAQAELLSRLDERPGAWRRLALAFVEAQTLGGELRSIRDESMLTPAPATSRGSAPPDAVFVKHEAPWSKLFALAATMLVAVGIGFGVGRVWNRPARTPATDTTHVTERVTQPIGDSRGVTTSLVDNAPLTPQGMMTVHTADGSPVELPVYEASQGAQRMLAADETSVPPELIRALRRRGHEVKQQRRLWPVDLGDGRQIIVPVDQVDVQYVGNRAYQ